MIKLSKLLLEAPYDEEPSFFSNEQEIIQDYINGVDKSEGVTIDDIVAYFKNPATQLKVMKALANQNLLMMKSKSNEFDDEFDDTEEESISIPIPPEDVEKIMNSQFDIAMGALANYNLNEDNPCWDGYKVGNPKTKISSKTGKRVNNCVPINENKVDHYIDKDGKQFQVVDANYLQYPGRVMVKYNGDPVEYKGNFEADLKSGMIERLDEAFFIGEDEIEKNNEQEEVNVDVKCEKCGWEWNTKDSENFDKYICHNCDYDNSYRYANKANNETIDEYDVDETNLYEVKDFIKFIKEYTSFLAEAQCDCVMEAKYHGRTVTLGKPMQGDIKKFKVYVKNNKGKVVKVNFGFGGKSAKGKRMVIKAKNPKRRSAYRKRHHCDTPGPRWKANYWSCRKW
jgi:hypothetical protein